MEKNLEVLQGYEMHYQVFTEDNMGYMFNGHIGFARGTCMDKAIRKVRKMIEAEGKEVTFYSVKVSNVKKFNDEIELQEVHYKQKL